MRIKGRILFIGNDTEISNLVVRILNRQGCQAASVVQEKALMLIAENAYDCVIVDCLEDYFRNRDFYKEVQGLARTTPVYLFTGIASAPEVHLAFRSLEEENYALLNIDGLIGVSARMQRQEQ